MRRALALLLILPLLMVGCGDRSLIVTVDILSFLDPGERAEDYNVPGGLSRIDVDVASDNLNLLPGIEDATDVVTATLDVQASFDNRTGSASGMLRLFMAPGNTDPFTTAALDSLPVTLTPSTVTNVEKQITSRQLADALVQKSARIGVRVSFDTRATAFTDSVTGTMTISKLTATVITKKNL
jgi:hypothetical protein